MPSGSGEGFGVEVGRVWRAGAVLLPKVSNVLSEASYPLTDSHTVLMSRSPGLGADPSAKFDALQSLIKKAVVDSREAIDTCAQALVWAAEDYQLTDQAARDAFEREKKRLG